MQFFQLCKGNHPFFFIFILVNSKWFCIASANFIQNWRVFDQKKVSQLLVDHYIYVAKFIQNWQLLFDLAKLEYGGWY